MDTADKTLLDKTASKLYEALTIQEGVTGIHRSSDRKDAYKAHRAHNLALLQLFLNHVTDDSITFHMVRLVHGALENQGIKNPESHVNSVSVGIYSENYWKLVDLKASGAEAVPERSCFMILAAGRDQKLIDQIVYERWPGSFQQALALLSEMEHSTLPLSSGNL